MNTTTPAVSGHARRTTGRITGGQKVTGRARTCLPARAARGGEPWRYPDGDDTAVVRGED